ncbi:MAG: hypothetical protein F4X76_05970 [Chloroflexi bacterium]|nr:hypothetical protein [Chloroflexota bacterium]
MLRGAPLEAGTVTDRESMRAALGREQAAALGWRTVLTFAFGALIVAAIAGVLLDIAMRREERENERVAIDALGGRPAGWLGGVAAETLIRLGAAAAVGVATGIVLARWLLAVLARDASGILIEPPLLVQVEAGPLWTAGVALAAGVVVTVAAAALRYRGRAMRPSPARAVPAGEA